MADGALSREEKEKSVMGEKGKSDDLALAFEQKAKDEGKKQEFKNELALLINRLSLENIESQGQYGIRDYILAEVGVDAIYSFAKNFHSEMSKRKQ